MHTKALKPASPDEAAGPTSERPRLDVDMQLGVSQFIVIALGVMELSRGAARTPAQPKSRALSPTPDYFSPRAITRDTCVALTRS